MSDDDAAAGIASRVAFLVPHINRRQQLVWRVVTAKEHRNGRTMRCMERACCIAVAVESLERRVHELIVLRLPLCIQAVEAHHEAIPHVFLWPLGLRALIAESYSGPYLAA